MEAFGTNLVVENENGAKVAVTLVNVPFQDVKKRQTVTKTLPISKINCQKSQFSSTTQTQKVKQQTTNNGVQICDDRFISSYQVAHCQVAPTSPPLDLREFPQHLSAPKTKYKKTRRVTRDPDYFVDNLRKYPKDLIDLNSTSELIERVLSASLSKQVSKEQDKYSTLRSKRAKENPAKVVQPHRGGYEKGNFANDGNHTVKPNAAKRISSPVSRNRTLRDSSSRVQRMGRVAEIRYLTDVRNCIKDAIKHVWDDENAVCPSIQERLIMHQRKHHMPCCSKDGKLQTASQNVEPQKSSSGQDLFKTCSVCQSFQPCHCSKKRIIRDDVVKCTKFKNQSLNDFCKPNPCCRFCQEKREYQKKVFTHVLKWMQNIPVDANCSCDDKIRRQSVMRELINTLVEFRGMEEKQKEAIEKFLDILPMWQPIDQSDRDLFVNKFVENLMNRLKELWNADNNLTEIVSNWINEKILNKMPKNDEKTTNRVVHTIVDRIKSLKLETIPDKDKAKKFIETNVRDILKDISLGPISDPTFLDKAANSLAEDLSVTLTCPNTKNTSEKDYNNTSINLTKENRQWSNFSLDERRKKKPKLYHKPHIDIPMSTTTTNIGNSLQYYNKQTQTTDSIELIAGNEAKFVGSQTIHGYVEKKLLDVLPLNVNANLKEDSKNEILKVMSKNFYLPSSIKKEVTEHNSANETYPFHFNTSVSLSELPITRLQKIRDCVQKQVNSIFDQYGITNKQKETKSKLINILTDHIMRGDNQESVKNAAGSILQELNISESQAGELYNTTLREVKNMSLISQNTPQAPDVDSSPYEKKSQFSDTSEKEIINFINEIADDIDPFIKRNLLRSTKELADDIEKLILSTNHCTENKEKMITTKLYNFLKKSIYPTDETLLTYAKTLAKRLLLIPVQSSPTSSVNRQDDGHINHDNDRHINKDDQFIPEINENFFLDAISEEISKWIEKIPTGYRVFHDIKSNKMLAKEIAKKVITSMADPNVNSDSVLSREIQQWLPKIVKEPNQAGLEFLVEDLKEILQTKLQSDIILLPDPVDNHDNFTEDYKPTILDWLRKSQIFESKNTQKNLLHESLASNLARDINKIINRNVSAKTIANMDEELLRAIQARIKQFTMDPKLKYHKYNRELSHQLLNSLKQLSIEKQTNSSLEEIYKNSKLAIISKEILKWIENIPSNHKVSHDEHQHKVLGQELAKKVLAPMSAQKTTYDSLLDRELLQWLPKIVKPDEGNLQLIARDLKETIKRKLPSDHILLLKTQDNPNQLIEDLKGKILDWVTKKQLNQTQNMHESLALKLARDLNEIICPNIFTKCAINKDELMLKVIQKYLKQITSDQNLKDDDKNIREIAFDLLNHLTKCPCNKETDALPTENNEIPKIGLLSNEVLKWIENIQSNYKLSQDKSQHELLAKDIAKKIMAQKLISKSPSESVLVHELMQWLPNIVKHSNPADLQLLAEDLKKTIQQNVLSDVIPIPKSMDIPNLYTKKFKESIIDWLKKTQRNHKIGIQEKLLRETLASNLARDLNNIILSNRSANTPTNTNEEMLTAIQTRLKQFTLDPKLKYNEKYIREMSSQLLKHLKQLHFNKESDLSLGIINESVKLGAVSNEIFKWIENIPSEYKLSHDKDQLKMLAKEISKRVQTPTSARGRTSNWFLEREILQWLPKLLIKLNDSDLQLVVDDLKEIIKQNLSTDVISIWKFSDNPNLFTENLKGIIMDWVNSVQIYKKRNSQEDLLQKSLVSNLARDLNDIICASSSTDSAINKDELIMRAIQTRMKQFTTNPKVKYNEKYNHEVALELLKLLKRLPLDRAVEASFEKLDPATKVDIISNEVFKWIENIPSDYKVSFDKQRQKILAKEIAKRVLAPPSSPNPNSDSFLEHELLQCLPNVVKNSNEADLKLIANDLKQKIKGKLPNNVVSVPESPESVNKLTDNLRRDILECIRNTQMYQTRNLQEKLLQENLVTKLARDLNDIICDKNYRDSDVSSNEIMLNAIKTYIKKFPMEPKLKYNENYHHKISSEILKCINKLRTKTRSSIKKEKVKNIISKWLHNLPLISAPDYPNTFDKLCSLSSTILESNTVDYETDTYFKNKVIDVLQDLPLNDEFRSYEKLQTLADNLIKSLQHEQNQMEIQEDPSDQHTNLNKKESSPKNAAISYDQVPVSNIYVNKSVMQDGQSVNNNEENNSGGTKVGHNKINFPNRTIATDMSVENKDIPHQQIASGEKPVYFGDQNENRKKVEEIKEKFTSGLINILDTSNLNSHGTIDENILKNDIEKLINELSKNIEYEEFLLPLKQDIVSITKEVAEINKKLSAEKDFKKVLHGVINNTLPATSDLLPKQITSFEKLKEKLIDAFINLNKASEVNTQRYKDDLKKEVNKFCYDYLQGFSATPVNAEQLCENLYTALQNVSFPKESVSSKLNRSNIEDEVEHFLNELPLQDNEKNNILKKKFVKSLVNHLRKLKAQDNVLLQNNSNLDRLEGFITEETKQFSFNRGEIPNIRDFAKNIIDRLESQNAKKKYEYIMRQRTEEYSNQSGLQSHIPQGLSPRESDVQRFSADAKHRAQTDRKDDNQGTRNIGFQTDIPTEFKISKHSSKPKVQENRYKDIEPDRTLNISVPSKPIQNLDKQTSIKSKNGRPHENLATNEIFPRVIINEYHWDSRPSAQLDNLQMENPIKQSQLRRTVPSLPLEETKIPFTPLEYPKDRMSKNLPQRTYPERPRRPYYSTTEPHTSSRPIIEEHLNTAPSETKMLSSNVRYRYGQSGVKLGPTNVDKRESFTGRTFEPKKQRRKFCKDQFTTCSRSDLRRANAITDDAHYNEMIAKCRALSRNYVGNRQNFDSEAATVNDNYKKRRRSQSYCNCFKDKSRKIQDRGTAISKKFNDQHQPINAANSARCENCRGTPCPHPSFFYFK